MGSKPVLKTQEEIEMMRRAGRIVGVCLRKIRETAVPGISGEELDALMEVTIRGLGGRPSFKGYGGFPANFCLSINDEVVHGIPDCRVIREGDIVSADVGAVVDGYHADAAITFGVGEISAEAKKLIGVTKAALFMGIDQARVGKRLVDIARAIQNYVEKAGYSVVRDLVGHGVGREMHEPPQVPNTVIPGRSPSLKAGMTLAIEPMVNMGDWKIRREADGWTYRTCDGSLAAHFEHTVAITEKGPLILSREDEAEAIAT
ncbi:MAG: type I methionyl aminopeptidase [Armatimonadetes bacterium]|nr:type I methionyl aminopeptidase [Armatimonadota bacterium]NIM23661.1 type I methionyl aminopeptidase [Armatimonadota bacterium]NIM67531.1 type I methionyl aminopeptidase [Armatimonadota bacterium]NIM76053.1 type I methionyl aminopeptidase [Armatimonadota bacterium]NIN05717.1 type I methionyl aminopeptidase [Armatimonadota bacterium]